MPDWEKEIREALSQLALRPLREAEIVEEMGHHLEDRYEDLLLQGYAEDEAVQKTLSEFRQNEIIRDLRGLEAILGRDQGRRGLPGPKLRRR